jgi:uracil-DNA glycosylase family 4
VQYPDFFNAPVPSFGNLGARLLVVGLAPGLKGANRTGRPFTGDFAGEVLYSSLAKHGFAEGLYNPETVRHEASGLGHKGLLLQASGAPDNFHPIDCRITNAVRCVPQENKPETGEIKECNTFLKSEIGAMAKLRVILSLGLVSHKAVLMALGYKQSAFKFAHGAEYVILREGAGSQAKYRAASDPALSLREPQDDGGKIILINSYHCSRYNINTGTLTQAMFDDVVGRAKELLRSVGT